MPITTKLKRELYEEQNGRCAGKCRKKIPFREMQVDRNVPGAYGGVYSRGNVQLMCGPCNRAKGAN